MRRLAAWDGFWVLGIVMSSIYILTPLFISNRKKLLKLNHTFAHAVVTAFLYNVVVSWKFNHFNSAIDVSVCVPMIPWWWMHRRINIVFWH